jgi:hypothetical protein
VEKRGVTTHYFIVGLIKFFNRGIQAVSITDEFIRMKVHTDDDLNNNDVEYNKTELLTFIINFSRFNAAIILCVVFF